MKSDVAGNVISSWLLIMQSKRLMLASAQRRAGHGETDELGRRIARLKGEAADAQDAYRSAMLRLGTPQNPDYWPVAYSRLIGIGRRLSDRLTAESVALTPNQRDQVSADVEMIDQIVDAWTESMRSAIASA
jgi:hypothetical protein